MTLGRMVSRKWSGESQVEVIADQMRGEEEVTVRATVSKSLL